MDATDIQVTGVDTTASSDNEQAYAAVLPAALALPEGDYSRITTDVHVAAGSVEPQREAIAALRAEAVEALPRHDFKTFDALYQRSQALEYADALYRTAVSPPPPTAPLVDELGQELQILLAEAHLLSTRGLIPAINDEAVQLGNNHRQLALNTINAVVHIRTHWSAIEGKTTMTRESLKSTEHKAERLARLVALRDSQPARVAEASRIRGRMFALFLQSVKEVARAAEYLHENEVDKYVPQVFTRAGRPSKASNDTQAKAEAKPEAEPKLPAQTTPPPAMNGEVGSPHSSPFVRAS